MYSVILLFVIIVVITLGIRNNHTVDVDLFFLIYAIPLSAVIGLSFLVGFLLSWLISLYKIMKYQLIVRSLNKQINRINNE